MLLDGVVIVLLILSMYRGRRAGLFRTVARFASLVLAAVCNFFWGKKIIAWFSGTPLYASIIDKISNALAAALEKENSALFLLHVFGAGKAAENVAQSITDTLLLIVAFLLCMLLVRVLIELLDRVVFRLPLVRPLNRIFGMVFSGVFTLIILYLIIGALGGFAVFSSAGFIGKQIESSYVVKFMYENNIVLDFILGKG